MFHSKPLRISSHVDQLLVHVEDPVVGAVTDGVYGHRPSKHHRGGGHRHGVLRIEPIGTPGIGPIGVRLVHGGGVAPEAAIGEVLPPQEADSSLACAGSSQRPRPAAGDQWR